mmetsp:Transcript_15504/g.34870  ORF Transcript_15504/g.34870 Transcript_15504/m.34870 type:complete len:444 (-) Transcript_15504:508-1839(-)
MAKKTLVLVALAALLTSSSAFAPGSYAISGRTAKTFVAIESRVEKSALFMASSADGKVSKRKVAFKTVSKVAASIATVALTITGAPPAALAAKKVVEDVVPAAKGTVCATKVAGGVAAAVVAAVATKSVMGGEKKQNFLEAEPYWDQSTVPVNTAKAKSPHIGKVISTKRIVGPKATGETCHIVIDNNGELPYWEGQSFGVIPPGTREKDGKPHSVRLYSIAASRYGDDMTGKTTSLCVRRATYWCPELKADDPAKKGICSNFLCDTQPGDEVKLTGPSGKVMLMPEKDPETDIIMVATGTGIAPYRAFIRRLFVEQTPAAEAYKGTAWLFLGVANSDALLYDDEWQDAKERFPDNFRLDYALSREQENKQGGKMYIQDKVEEYSDEIFNRLDQGAHIYFCGLKGMMPGIQDMLKEVCKSKDIDYEEWLKGLKKAKQWHVEVY